MSEQSTPGSRSRRRPTYGLPAGDAPTPSTPGPSGQGDGPQPSAQQDGATVVSSPQVAPHVGSQPGWGAGSSAADAPWGSMPQTPPPGAGGSWAGASGPVGPKYGEPTYGGSTPDGGGSGAGGRSRRRGLVPLIVGLVLLLVIGPGVAVGSVLLSMRDIISAAANGPAEISADGTVVDLKANEMVLLYVPQADETTAQCTAEPADAEITVAHSTGAVELPQGTYVQKRGIVAMQDTQITLSCTGLSQDPALYLGPMSLVSIGMTMLVGILVALALGFVGLVLTVVGIVGLVRSCR